MEEFIIEIPKGYILGKSIDEKYIDCSECHVCGSFFYERLKVCEYCGTEFNEYNNVGMSIKTGTMFRLKRKEGENIIGEL